MPFRRLTSLFKRTALAFIALVVLLGLTEIGTRLFAKALNATAGREFAEPCRL